MRYADKAVDVDELHKLVRFLCRRSRVRHSRYTGSAKVKRARVPLICSTMSPSKHLGADGHSCHSWHLTAPNNTKRVQRGDAGARSSTQLRLPAGDQRLMRLHEERTVRQEELVTAIPAPIMCNRVIPWSSGNL